MQKISKLSGGVKPFLAPVAAAPRRDTPEGGFEERTN
jgi:hypothetical protein